MKGKCKPEEKQLKLLTLALSYLLSARNLSSHLHALIPLMTPVTGFIWTLQDSFFESKIQDLLVHQ